MRERAEAIGATLTVSVYDGVEVSLAIPVATGTVRPVSRRVAGPQELPA
jgi:hypothetical protein